MFFIPLDMFAFCAGFAAFQACAVVKELIAAITFSTLAGNPYCRSACM